MDDTVKIKCVWEHNGDDTLLYAVDFPGAFTRGENLQTAVDKMCAEIHSYCKWAECQIPDHAEVEIVQDAACSLQVCDADSDVLFESETAPLTIAEYHRLKALALKSAEDFLKLYRSIPDKTLKCAPPRKTFYGDVPCSAHEMYEHTKNVNAYYFGEIDADADNDDDILECRLRGFEVLEKKADFLKNQTFEGSYGECWTLRKLLRRFIWHDRIHAKAMYNMAVRAFGLDAAENVFCFKLGSTVSGDVTGTLLSQKDFDVKATSGNIKFERSGK